MNIGITPTPNKNLIRVQEKGQITLPAEVRRRLGIKQGDLVSVVETPQGVLIAAQEVVAKDALDRIGQALRAKGLSLEELIDSGRDERAEAIKEERDDEQPRQ